MFVRGDDGEQRHRFCDASKRTSIRQMAARRKWSVLRAYAATVTSWQFA